MKTPKYKLRSQDIDVDQDVYILNLPAGFQFLYDKGSHTRGYDTMKELRNEARTAVIPCNCTSCRK